MACAGWRNLETDQWLGGFAVAAAQASPAAANDERVNPACDDGGKVAIRVLTRYRFMYIIRLLDRRRRQRRRTGQEIDKRRGQPCHCQNSAPVAQLDRVSGYEPEGRAFESLRVRHPSPSVPDLKRPLLLKRPFRVRSLVRAACLRYAVRVFLFSERSLS